MPTLTLYFIIQPPNYLYMACHLAASIRTHLPPDVEVIGYCPAASYDEMAKEPLEVLRRLRCKIVRLETDGFFSPDYPHGNKLIAALAPKTTDYAVFLDSDMAFMRPCSIEELVADSMIGVVPSTSMRWADQSIWGDIYSSFDMPIPDERVTMTRDKRHKVVPYFNAGLVVIDENYRTPDGKRFAEVWMETAQALDQLSFIPYKRPYLDQMTLPVAIQRAGMSWNILPERYNYSIGGILRGKKLAKDADVTLLHYRNRDVLGDAGRKKDLDKMLHQQLGTRLVRWIFDVPEDRSLPLKHVATMQTDQTVDPTIVPDPSKAAMAAVTFWDGDLNKLVRWLGYYGTELGVENLYVLAKADFDLIKAQAPEANVIPIPSGIDDEAIWGAISAFASGLTLYYNWVLSVEDDEFLLIDPIRAANLKSYLSHLTAKGRVPWVSMPLGFDVLSLGADGPAYARQAAGLQKPCMVRSRVSYGVGGRLSNIKSFSVDPHLCLMKVRAEADEPAVMPKDAFQNPSSLDLPKVRRALREGKIEAAPGMWTTSCTGEGQVYRLPARFRDKLLGVLSGEKIQ